MGKDGICNSELQINCKLRYCRHLLIFKFKIHNVCNFTMFAIIRNFTIIHNSAIICNSAIIRNSDWSIFVKKTSINTALITNDPNFIKILPLAVSESFNEFTDFSDDKINEQEDELNTLKYENNNDNLFENNKEIPSTSNEMIMENYFNFDDEDLQKTLELEVRVIIEQEITNYDHRENDYDINTLLNANFNEGQNKE